MDYQKHYNLLIEKSKNRLLENVYVERHHIIPKCKGGSDDISNIAVLTPEEHYVAHLLLVNIYPKDKSLLWAAMCMTGDPHGKRNNNKIYGWLRKEFSEMLSKANMNKVVSEETRKKQSLAKLGSKQSLETIEKRVSKYRGKKKTPHTDETKEKMKIARSKQIRQPHSEETKIKMSKAITEALKHVDQSYKQDPEYKRKQSEKMKEIWNKRKQNNNNNNNN